MSLYPYSHACFVRDVKAITVPTCRSGVESEVLVIMPSRMVGSTISSAEEKRGEKRKGGVKKRRKKKEKMRKNAKRKKRKKRREMERKGHCAAE